MVTVYEDNTLALMQVYLEESEFPISSSTIHPDKEQSWWSFIDGNRIGYAIRGFTTQKTPNKIAMSVLSQTKSYGIWSFIPKR
jgi:hypothetical protein